MDISSSIAFRYMRAKRKEHFISLITVISIAGVGLGVAALIVVLAVMTGFESNLRDKFLGINPHVVIRYADSGIKNWEPLLEKAQAVPGVVSAEAFVYGQVLGSGPGGSNGVMIKGMDAGKVAADGQLAGIRFSESALELLRDQESLEAPPIILGRDLSLILGAGQYSIINIISPFGRITPLGARAPLSRAFQVVGTFKTGLYEFDSSMAYMSMGEAQSLLALPDGEATTIELKVKDIYQAGQIREQVLERFDDERFWGRDWMQMNIGLFAALKLERVAMFVILTLIILVAAFNIVATLIMMVMEKTGDIAILKSMGASPKQIRRIFTIQGMSAGVIGAAGGLAIGVTICFLLQRYRFIELPPEIYLIDTIPVEMRPVYLISTVLVTLAISFLATIYPASQAAKLDPVEALRYE